MAVLLDATPPAKLNGARLTTIELTIEAEGSSISFEERCRRLEDELCKTSHDLICNCCMGETSVCASCTHAIGFHRCEHIGGDQLRWRRGSLHGGKLDVERCLWNLHRKRVPTQKIREKAGEFVKEARIKTDEARRILDVIEAERRLDRVANAAAEGGPTKSRL